MNEKARSSMNKVVESFRTGNLSPLADVARIRLSPDAPAAKWSYCNRVMAYMQTHDVDCRGYRQWQAVGRQVKSGEHAGYIFVPRVVKDKEDESVTHCVGFLTAAVFGYHQTDGNGNGMSYTPSALPPLADVAAKLGISVSYAPLVDCLGSCNAEGDKVAVGAGDASVFFHELAHACHARINGKLKVGQHTDQETVAEVTAAVLMHLYGLGDRTGNCWQYIASYDKDPLHAVGLVLEQVEQVLNVITGDKHDNHE